ncbi:hypothetical protein K2Z83_18510 [Oscillochloris sp. ZM17-4]|uniref:hypothetical protein n=1 Tax=Oscillochloris sp. ZM17-4 TaxID=2866714 RepID=UPI001C730FA1|nr:hypothetical protein [Oscillochloris sp. ZM17-4]MBX0329666.1 hypothetical protein [Oscillochloris sp. ZM17-4]
MNIDELLPAASQLAQRDIRADQATWPAYNRLWLEILHAVSRNGMIALLFAPLDREDLARVGRLPWVDRIAWLLLDCDAQTRQARLRDRPGWSEDQIADALHDAQHLREQLSARIDTGIHRPHAVVDGILAWVERSSASSD